MSPDSRANEDAQANPLSRLPSWVSRWFGYRASPHANRSQLVVWAWSWIAAFCGLNVIMAVFGQAEYFFERNVPLLVASYAASAVLIYGAIEAPLAQPRALIVGHFIGALIGVCVTKLFQLSSRFQELRWLSGSISCATAIVVMQMTETTHPPAGATAILPSLQADITDLGWYYLPVILLSSTLALAVALLINNIQRRYPVFWIAPVSPIPVLEKSGASKAPSLSSTLNISQTVKTVPVQSYV